jgi:hypothetical protein
VHICIKIKKQTEKSEKVNIQLMLIAKTNVAHESLAPPPLLPWKNLDKEI